MKRGALIAITRDWSAYFCGEHFRVAKVVDGGNGQLNVRCLHVLKDEVVPDDQLDNILHQRTLPAEYCVEVPRVGSGLTVNANQADRDGTILAVLADEMLIEYEMPAGKTFLRIQNFMTDRHRSISRNALPKKWRKELEA